MGNDGKTREDGLQSLEYTTLLQAVDPCTVISIRPELSGRSQGQAGVSGRHNFGVGLLSGSFNSRQSSLEPTSIASSTIVTVSAP